MFIALSSLLHIIFQWVRYVFGLACALLSGSDLIEYPVCKPTVHQCSCERSWCFFGVPSLLSVLSKTDIACKHMKSCLLSLVNLGEMWVDTTVWYQYILTTYDDSIPKVSRDRKTGTLSYCWWEYRYYYICMNVAVLKTVQEKIWQVLLN